MHTRVERRDIDHCVGWRRCGFSRLRRFDSQPINSSRCRRRRVAGPRLTAAVAAFDGVEEIEVVQRTAERVRGARARPPNDEIVGTGGAREALAASVELAGGADRLGADVGHGQRQRDQGDDRQRDGGAGGPARASWTPPDRSGVVAGLRRNVHLVVVAEATPGRGRHVDRRRRRVELLPLLDRSDDVTRADSNAADILR